ncbi:hypothetical protein ACCO45_007863 [Purpureocillium lilacinum]|uniref:Uncharacterized protein n=1 Tax=Purpureocillium lilacinum TaxID=33203 RepID=A0ACC4DLN6_PURLI
MLVASRRSRARQQAERSLSLLVGWVVSWRSEDLRDARVATWQATLPDWQPACARVWVGLLGFQSPEGHPGGFVSAWADPVRTVDGGRRPAVDGGEPGGHAPAIAANEQRSPAPRTKLQRPHGLRRVGCASAVQVGQARSGHSQTTGQAHLGCQAADSQRLTPSTAPTRPAACIPSPSFVPRPRTGCTPLHLVRAADGAALASSLMPDPGGVGNGQASPAPATKNRPRHTSSPDLHINDAAPAVAFSGETLRRVRCGRVPSSPRKEKIANSPALSGRLLSVSAHIVLPSEPLKPAPASFFVSVVVRPRARRQSVDSPAERPAVNAPRPLLHRHCITARSRHRLTSDQADDLPPSSIHDTVCAPHTLHPSITPVV